jgi:hypothetical protein
MLPWTHRADVRLPQPGVDEGKRLLGAKRVGHDTGTRRDPDEG